MNKYLATLLFYIVAIVIVIVLSKLSPNAHDGGPGLGSLAIVVLALIIIVLFAINLYRGFQTDKSYFIIAGIHLLVLIIVGGKLFGVQF